MKSLRLLLALIILLCLVSNSRSQSIAYDIAPIGRVQYFSNSGVPLNGGKLYTYLAGTTTPASTYSSFSGSSGTPNTNPVVLDTYGRATIYLASTVSYKFVLKTSADVTLWTQDYVSPVSASIYQQLTAGISHASTLVKFNPGASGVTYTDITENGGLIYTGNSLSIARDTTAALTIATSHASNNAYMIGYRSRGTIATKSDVVNGDLIYAIYSSPWSGAQYFGGALIGFKVDGTFTTNQAPPTGIFFSTNAANANPTIQASIDSAGLVTLTRSLVIGAATGGDKGAGTINVDTDIYKDNTAYTNPDYALEHWVDGRITKFSSHDGAKEYKGRLSLADLESYIRTNYRLPGINDSPMGAFKRSDKTLEKLEELTTYIIDQNHRINTLEEEVRNLKKELNPK